MVKRFEAVWPVLDAQVAAGRMPGYVAAVRARGDEEIRAGGRLAVEADSALMGDGTLFRIASVTKPMGGALTLGLVHDGIIALSDPVTRWLPEAEHPRVLVTPDARVDRTTEAQRPITVRHLLTCTSGWGIGLADTPLRTAMTERDVHPGPLPTPMSGDEYVARVTDLPLAFQPGGGWLYDTSINLLGVLLARATGKSLSELFTERITGPLGLDSTGSARRTSTAWPPRTCRSPAGSSCSTRPTGSTPLPLPSRS